MPWTNIVRLGECPDVVRLNLAVPKEACPELAEWLWRHPYTGAKAVRDVLAGKLKDGTLDRIDREANSGQVDP